MEFKQIQELIKLIDKSDIGELRVSQGDFEIRIRSKHYTEALYNAVGNGQFVPTGQALQGMSSVPGSAAPSAMEPSLKTGSGSPADTQAAVPSEQAEAGTENLITIKSPMVGTFYRRPSPDKEPFSKVGDHVDKGHVLCIIEAMKLFNEIESEQTGRIVKVFLEDASPVEYDQPLFLIDPNG